MREVYGSKTFSQQIYFEIVNLQHYFQDFSTFWCTMLITNTDIVKSSEFQSIWREHLKTFEYLHEDQEWREETSSEISFSDYTSVY